MRHPSTVQLVVLGMILIWGTTLLFSATCRELAEPTVYVVEGIVRANGEPAANVHVAFHPLDGGKNRHCPVGRTNSNGIFHLTTHSGADGAPAGEYSVTLFWPDDSIEIDECECPDPSIHDRFKGLYAQADQGFRVRIDSSGKSFQFSAWRPRSDDSLRHGGARP